MTTTASIITWPPPHTVRISRRAKRVILKITIENGLELVLPERIKRFDPSDFFEQHRDWIITKLSQQAVLPSNSKLPTQLNLQALGEVWTVTTMTASGKPKLMQRPDRSLILYGDLSDQSKLTALLRRWVLTKAKPLLKARLQAISQHTGYQYQALSVRGQKTRWGSCSSQGDISLNFKLIYLPIELLDHVVLHELCHTQELNHSKRFWNLVAKHDANWQEHRRTLNSFSLAVSEWGG